jgi:hypothetical protein
VYREDGGGDVGGVGTRCRAVEEEERGDEEHGDCGARPSFRVRIGDLGLSCFRSGSVVNGDATHVRRRRSERQQRIPIANPCTSYDDIWYLPALLLQLITNCQFIRTETIEESQQSRVSGDCRPDLKGCASCISRKRLIARSHNNVL